jgi:magnesium transporter
MRSHLQIGPVRRVRVVLSSTALLSFISVWKAAALALAELGVAAFFIAGTTQSALGPATPWLVLAGCLLSVFVRAFDIESWALFIPGGLLGRAEQAFGPRATRMAAAAVLTERFLLGALACVVVGHYVATVITSAGWRLPDNVLTAELASVIAVMLLGSLWIRARVNFDLARDTIARGVWIGAGIIVTLTVWAALTLAKSGLGRVDLFVMPSGSVMPVRWPVVGAVLGFLYGFGLVLPTLGGGDALTREAHDFPPPRVHALRRTRQLVVLFAFLAIGLPAFLFSLLVPEADARLWIDSPLFGLAQHVAGPAWTRGILTIALAAGAFLMLAPAAHIALEDAVQTFRRLSTSGSLPEGLASPHPRFGTPSHAIDVAAASIVLIMLAAGGRVTWLGRAYAIGIAATLLVKIAVLIRFRAKRPEARPYRALFNLRFGPREVPLGLLGTGLLVVAAALLLIVNGDFPAIAATGLFAGLALLIVPTRSAEVAQPESLDAFELLPSGDLSLGQVDARPGNVLVPIRNPHSLAHVAAALQASGDRDVVVMTVRMIGLDVDEDASNSTDSTPTERELFSRVIALAERYNRPVRLLIVPAHNVFEAIAATVLRLGSSEVFVGESQSLSAAEQARLMGDAWERAEKPEGLEARLVIYHHSGRADAYHLGAHPPSLSPGDLDLIHRVWLDAVKAVGPHVHHHDVVRAALTQMEQQLTGPQREDALAVIRQVARPADELAAVVRQRDFTRLRDMVRNYHAGDLATLLTELDLEDQVVVFRVLPRKDAAAVFEYLSREAQATLLKAMAQEDVAALLNNMAPDDRTMFLEELPAAATRKLLSLLTPAERAVAMTLLGYPESSVGRLMTPNYVAVREQWTVREVLDHVRQHGQDSETLNVIYVVDEQGLLIDDIRIRELLLTSLDNRVSDLMDRRFVALKATDDQQEAVAAFRKYDRTALPVTDTAGMLIGIVTIDDVLDVAEATATKEIQRIGGMEALDEPYMDIAFGRMLQKRAGWLTALFLGELLTATAMGAFEAEISKAVVLALFVPLIISSGGNSGSQAATLVIRALALGEVGIADWWRVMRREILAGLALGSILGAIGFLRITIWSAFSDIYGQHWLLVAITVGVALVGIVLWGTLIGSLLPFLLRRLGFDPATSSAPFVATLVDVTGLVIYFSVAMVILRGTLL